MIPLQEAQRVLDVDDIINVSGVKRWHMLKMDRQQTLAEHQYLVAMMATKMFYDCVVPARSVDERDSIQRTAFAVLSEALIHDIHETKSGDTPANPKALARCKELLGGLDLGDMIQADYWDQKAESHKAPKAERTSGAVVRFVKIIDKFEALCFFALNGDTRTYNSIGIIDGLVGAVVRATNKLTEEDQRELGLRLDAVKWWVKYQLHLWAGRFNPNCGATTEAVINEMVNAAFPEIEYDHHDADITA